jgi:hypothetical protein
MASEREDDYGNELTEDGEYAEGRPQYCTFPDCGCDGARLCVAKDGASESASKFNVEGMYQRKDKVAFRGRMGTAGLCLERNRKERPRG